MLLILLTGPVETLLICFASMPDITLALARTSSYICSATVHEAGNRSTLRALSRAGYGTLVLDIYLNIISPHPGASTILFQRDTIHSIFQQDLTKVLLRH